MTTESLHTLFLTTTGAVTDTRKIEKDTMFFALRGENFNGNEFAEEAIEKGAKFAIVDDRKYKTSDRIITVNNCLLSLQELAKFHRKYINPSVVFIKRCYEFIDNPPDKDWDGHYRLDKK